MDNQFWQMVDTTGDCWLWMGAVKPNGYGIVKRRAIRPSPIGAHVHAWTLTNGPVPDGHLVLHHCDNRRCVRPDHLHVGTMRDNARDRAERNTSHPNARRLTADQCAEIRRRWAAGARQVDLAAEYTVSQVTVSRIVRGDHWSSVR